MPSPARGSPFHSLGGLWQHAPRRNDPLSRTQCSRGFHRVFAPALTLGQEPVDLVVFETGESHVVSSKDLQKALIQRADSTARYLAVGYDFTEEARALVD